MKSEWLWRGEEALRLDVWMERALYDEECGYYARKIRAVGKGGDFTTVPMQGDGLARGIVRWLVEQIREKRVWQVVELGAGEGKLMEDVRRLMPWWLRWRVTWNVVEVSASLRARQKARLGRGVRWFSRVEEVLEATGGRAIFFSNELLDAFAARQFLTRGDGVWCEAWVRRDGAREWREVEDLPKSRQFAEVVALGVVGQVVEIQESVEQWLAGWMPRWRTGAFLAVDYGAASSREMYERRVGGTLRGYFHHQRVTGLGVFRNVGWQDLTVDVHWGDVRDWFEQQGGKFLTLEAQHAFLERFGVGSDAAWNDVMGAGTAFQVWVGECGGRR